MITAPVVAGARDESEAVGLAAAAASLGLTVVSRHDGGRGRLVLELEPEPHRSSGAPALDGTATGAAATAAATGAVRALRAQGWAVIDGPLTPAYAPVWARRNAPTPFAPGAAVCFPWSPVDRARFELVVDIAPGAGFGAGGHPTTLALLAGLVDPTLEVASAPAAAPGGLARRDGFRVLDVGCGTGVLAVAAALTGAGPVGALDIAPEALAATAANAARNGVADRVRLLDADLALCPGPWDLVLANIHAHVLIGMAPHLARLTAPGGLLGLSGLSPSQPSLLEAALRPMEVVRTEVVRADHHDEWVGLWLRHPA